VSKKPSGLGKGLEALLPKARNPLIQVPVALIHPNPAQPRQVFREESLAELAQSIREKGVLQPLLVRPKGEGYELIAGERRYRAALLAGLEEVPAIVGNLGDREALELALVENLQREDLNPVEEARGFARLLEMGLSQEEIARAVGKARSTVTNALRLLQLPSEVLEALEEGLISAGHARALLMLPEEERLWGLRQILTRGLSVRQAETLRPPSRTKSRSRESYPEIAASLSQRLGLPVRLLGQERGRLEIAYRSQADLERLLQLLGYEPS
jgi:ParB family chromosome partitioning protein